MLGLPDDEKSYSGDTGIALMAEKLCVGIRGSEGDGTAGDECRNSLSGGCIARHAVLEVGVGEGLFISFRGVELPFKEA